MLRRALAALGSVAIAAGLLLGVAAPASADPPICTVNPQTGTCEVTGTVPGTDPTPDPGTGLTPAPAVCYSNYYKQEIPCSSDRWGWWSNASQLYCKTSDDQSATPPAGSAATGGWYTCIGYYPPDFIGPVAPHDEWYDNPPPGITTFTPGQAAQALAARLTFTAIDIGFAPDPAVAGARSYVGVPIWMWVENPTPETFGPQIVSDTLGGVTVSLEAKVTSLIWNMGDGGTVPCASGGTPYRTSYGAVASPTCGYRYARTSDDQPNDRYTVTATSQWSIDWTAAGQTGSIPVTTVAQTTVRIAELQSVNVNGGNG